MKFLQDAKRQVTLCVACPMLAGQITGQIVFTGKTKKAIPAVDMPANITCTSSESHWSNTETMMEMFQAIAASVDSGPDAPIVVVLDCAPIHTSKEFRRRVREEMEWIKLVYVAPTHTATAQPLDVAYNFPLKASLTRVATAHFLKLLLDAIESDDKGARQVDTRMSSLKPLLPHWVGVALNELSLRCQQARTEKLSLRRPKNCTRRRSSFGQWAPAVEGFQKKRWGGPTSSGSR